MKRRRAREREEEGVKELRERKRRGSDGVLFPRLWIPLSVSRLRQRRRKFFAYTERINGFKDSIERTELEHTRRRRRRDQRE